MEQSVEVAGWLRLHEPKLTSIFLTLCLLNCKLMRTLRGEDKCLPISYCLL